MVRPVVLMYLLSSTPMTRTIDSLSQWPMNLRYGTFDFPFAASQCRGKWTKLVVLFSVTVTRTTTT